MKVTYALISLFLIPFEPYQQNADAQIRFVDPTGTYVLKGKKHRGEIKGNYGEIRVKLIDSSAIAMAFYSNQGYPDYKQGAFIDTLLYNKNEAIFIPEEDPNCKLIFDFEFEGVSIKRSFSNPTSTCGFGAGVVAIGFIPKYSTEIPVIQPLLRSD